MNRNDRSDQSSVRGSRQLCESLFARDVVRVDWLLVAEVRLAEGRSLSIPNLNGLSMHKTSLELSEWSWGARFKGETRAVRQSLLPCQAPILFSFLLSSGT